MASRLSALKESAMEAGEQIGQRAKQMSWQDQAMSLAIFAIVGVSGFAIGMLTGLLVAPMSGSETRNRLQNRASDMLSNVKQMAKKGQEQVSEKEEQIAS
jgi:MFS superfamily sulfate permease-like transporter